MWVQYAFLTSCLPWSLTIETSPPGARVFLDDVLLDGSTPLDTPVKPGKKYKLKIINEGYEDVVRTITVRDSIAPNILKIQLNQKGEKAKPVP